MKAIGYNKSGLVKQYFWKLYVQYNLNINMLV